MVSDHITGDIVNRCVTLSIIIARAGVFCVLATITPNVDVIRFQLSGVTETRCALSLCGCGDAEETPCGPKDKSYLKIHKFTASQ